MTETSISRRRSVALLWVGPALLVVGVAAFVTAFNVADRQSQALPAPASIAAWGLLFGGVLASNVAAVFFGSRGTMQKPMPIVLSYGAAMVLGALVAWAWYMSVG